MTQLRADTEFTPPVLEEREEQLRLQRRRLTHAASRVRADAAAELGALGAGAVPLLRDALKDSHVDVRVAAIGSLQRIGSPRAVDALITAMDDQEVEVRSNAAAASTTFGVAPTVDTLSEALRHKDGATRIAAAQALGAIGDPHAVPHLLAAHRRCFVSGSARGQLIAGAFIAGGIVLFLAAYLWGTFVAKLGGAIGCLHILSQVVSAYFRNRRKQSQVAAAISDALLRIAESSSAPEIHRIVPELRSVMRDRLQHTRETRAAAREAADRIEALTARLQQLPVASGAADAPADDLLPRPASAPATPARLNQ